MEPAEVILCVQQSWHSHVPLKENWPSCTAFLMESPRDQCSLSSSKGAQTINQYPTALRKWVSLKEEDLMGLFAFPLPIHLALCKLSERWIVGTPTWITLQYRAAATSLLRQLPGSALPVFPWGPERWTRSHLLPMATHCDMKHLAGWQGTG